MPPPHTRINSAGRVRTHAGWSLDKNWGLRFSDLDIWFVWAGTGWLKTNNHTYNIQPGFLLIARGGHIYEASHSPTQSLGVNFIHFDLLSPSGKIITNPLDPSLPPEVSYLTDTPTIDALTRRIVQLASQKSTLPLANALLQPVFQDLSLQAKKASRKPPPSDNPLASHIARWASLIQEDPAHTPPVSTMAANSNCSPDHFSRAFKSLTGLSPQLAIIHARTTRAKQLLLETDMKVRQIALALGYCDEFFFTRQFKQQTGQTPKQFRLSAL